MNSLPSSLVVLPHASPAEILRRVAMPFLLFATVLTALLMLSWSMLVPRLARVDVGGRTLTAEEIRAYRTDLAAQIVTGEGQRRDLVLSVQDPAYIALKQSRRGALSATQLLSELETQAKASADQPDAVHLSFLRYDILSGSGTLRGDVRFVGSRSMTVLASFVDVLGRLPILSSVTPPPFVREEDPVTGAHSPFALSFTIK